MLEFELVLPAFNEAESLPSLIQRVCQEASKAGFSSDQFQLILVENGSTDHSRQVLQDLKNGPSGKWFSVEIVPKNRGYGFGLMAGLRRSTAPIVGWSHADEQCDPADAFTAVQLLKSRPEKSLIKGRRSGRDPKNAAVSRIFAGLARIILGLPMDEINAQPKVFRRDLLRSLVEPPDGFEFDLYALFEAVRNGYTVADIPVLFPQRRFGTSKWAVGFFQRWKTMARMILYMIRLSIREGRL